jgi:glycosyltransferase involved in cell wall biosynthesis
MSSQKQPLVSVIIAFLNEEEFLSEAIESVLCQTFTNWELLLIDDGSLDKSASIALEYAERYPGVISYYEHEEHTNKGLSASRNLGIKKAKGVLIAPLDADDVWLPEKLKNQVAIFQRYPNIAMVAEGSVHWYNWNNPQRKNIEIPVGAIFKRRKIIPVKSHQDKVFEPVQLMFLLYPLGVGAAPGPCSWLLSKAAIIRNGGFEESFTKQYTLYEDQAFLCKIYLNEKIYLSSASNNLYRQRPDSVVSLVKEKGHYHIVRQFFLKWLQDYLLKQKINNSRLNKMIDKAMLPYRHPIFYFITHSAPHKVIQLSEKAISVLVKFIIKRRGAWSHKQITDA